MDPLLATLFQTLLAAAGAAFGVGDRIAVTAAPGFESTLPAFVSLHGFAPTASHGARDVTLVPIVQGSWATLAGKRTPTEQRYRCCGGPNSRPHLHSCLVGGWGASRFRQSVRPAAIALESRAESDLQKTSPMAVAHGIVHPLAGSPSTTGIPVSAQLGRVRPT